MIFMILAGIVFFIVVKETPKKIGLNDFVDIDASMQIKEAEMKAVLKEKGKLYPYIHLMKNWKFVVWLFIIAFSSIARYGLLTWVPTYFVEIFNTDIEAGIIGTLGLPLGMAFGAVIVPWLTDRFCPKNRMPAVIICALSSAALVFGFSLVGPGFGATAILFFAGFFVYSINGIAWTYATDVGGRVFSGTAAGVLDLFAYIGAGLQSIIFGSALGDSNNWTAVFITIAIGCCIIAVLSTVVGYLDQVVAKVKRGSSDAQCVAIEGNSDMSECDVEGDSDMSECDVEVDMQNNDEMDSIN